MRQFKLLVLTVAALLSINGLAQASTIDINSLINKGTITADSLTGSLSAQVNGNTVDLGANAKANYNSETGRTFASASGTGTNGSTFTVSLNGDPDPEIIWTASMTAGTTDTTYLFTFIQPFIGGPYGTLHSDVSGSTTASNSGGAGVQVTNIGLQVGTDPGTIYDHLVNGSCSTGGGSQLCPAFADLNINPLNPPTDPIGNMKVVFGATVSAFDATTFNGKLTLDGQVPEPGTVILLGSGLIALAWLRRKQTNS